MIMKESEKVQEPQKDGPLELPKQVLDLKVSSSYVHCRAPARSVALMAQYQSAL
jgi:hypothetical protein